MKIREIIEKLMEIEQYENALNDAENNGIIVPIGRDAMRITLDSWTKEMIKAKYIEKLNSVKSKLNSLISEIDNKINMKKK